MRSIRKSAAFLPLAAALALAAGCEDDPSRPDPPAAVAVLSGNAQPGTVGAQLPNPVVVRVTDDDGDPVRNVAVTFQVASGGGTVQPATTTTGSDGLAQAAWTLGPAAGPQTLTATVEGLPAATFTATAAAGAPARLRIQPDSSTIMALGQQATVQASYLDQFGNAAGTPAAGAVAWSSLDPTVATVGPGGQPGQGVATAVGPGRARIVATAGTLADTAVVGVVQAPASIVVQVLEGSTLVMGGTRQATTIVRDAAGVLIPNAALTWSTTNPAVVTVSQTGLITAVGPGTAEVRATASNGLAGSATITVLAALQAAAFSAGGHTTCALDAGGAAWCWGSNHSGQAGIGNVPEHELRTPRAVATTRRFQAISVGGTPDPQPWEYPRGHTCAIATDASAWCWGQSGYGQLGTGDITGSLCRYSANEAWTCTRAPVQVAGNVAWRAIAAGTEHTCAVSTAGAAWCWGANDHGQLGAATAQTCEATALMEPPPGPPCATAPVQVAGAPAFTSITAGEGFTCALTAAGAAWCWGRNDQGQLGNGTGTASTAPVQVGGGLVFSRIDAEYAHTCGVTTGGAVYCWGRNASGQLGNGSSTASATPVQVAGGGTWLDVSAGRSHTCAVRAGGGAWCWGSNSDGQLGVSGVTLATAPVQVSGGFAFNAVSVAGWHSCARRAGDSVLMCWGSNRYGRLGNESVVDSPTPVPVGAP